MHKKIKYSAIELIDRTTRQLFVANRLRFIIQTILRAKWLKWLTKPLNAYQNTINSAFVTPKQIYSLWLKLLKDINSTDSTLKKHITILYLTICDCLAIYLKAFLQTILLFILITFFACGIFFICYSLCILSKEIYLYVLSISAGISKDAWLNFTGSIFGGFITVFGIIITLKHERRRDELNNIRQVKPIIILRQLRDELGDDKKMKYFSYSINFQSFQADDNSVIEVDCPYLIIENIGFNMALDIDINIYVRHMCSASCSGVSSIETKEKIPYRINVSFIPECLEYFERVIVQKDRETLLHADLLRIRMLCDLEIDDIEMVASDPAEILLKFHDVNGIRYKQKHTARIFIARAKGQYYAAISCQSYSNSNINKSEELC